MVSIAMGIPQQISPRLARLYFLMGEKNRLRANVEMDCRSEAWLLRIPS